MTAALAQEMDADKAVANTPAKARFILAAAAAGEARELAEMALDWLSLAETMENNFRRLRNEAGVLLWSGYATKARRLAARLLSELESQPT